MGKFRILLALLLAMLCIPLSVRASENSPVRAGDEIVIYSPENSAALSGGKTGNYNQSVSISISDDALIGYGDSELWSAEANSDGSYRFLQNGQALSLGESYGFLRMDEAYDSWNLEDAGNGRWYVKNTVRALYLYLDPWRSRWSTSESPTALSFYIVSQAEEPTEPAPPEAGGWKFLFGQLHGHTDFSDGAGSVEDAFAHAKDTAKLDFFAITDHSQSFDNAPLGELNADGAAVSEEWAAGKNAARAVTDGNFAGLFGFEMTWNQGQGHMVTFGTPGFLSRDREEYGSYANGMENYYSALLDTEHSVSIFCHPGDTYGDFKNFGSHSPALDQKIALIETDFSGDFYDRALSLGWHLAPTASGSNHGPLWGDETAARTVILAETLTEDALLDAMANRRVYATEDSDLKIFYTLNGSVMGSILPRSQVGETVTITASLSDPTDDALGTVEVISEGICLTGCILTTARGEIALTLPANRDYYYLRITQPDGDVALTAPVWLDSQTDMGISSFAPVTPVTTAGSSQTFRLTLFNNESSPLEITSVTFATENAVYKDTSLPQVVPFGTAVCEFTHSFPSDGVYTVTATADAFFEGQPRQFSEEIRVIVMPPALVADVILDGTHGNSENLQPLLSLAAKQDVAVHFEQTQITAPLLETCRLLIIPTPVKDFSEDFLAAVKGFVSRGGSLILCGTSCEIDGQAAVRLNRLLNEIGSTMAFANNEVRDDRLNRGQSAQLYTAAFADSPWLEGLAPGQVYAQAWGCSIDPGSGTALITGEGSAYCTDGGSPVLLAAEQTTSGGTIFAAGCTFFAGDYLSAGDDWIPPLANQTIAENILGLLRTPQDTIPIGQLRRAESGKIYLAEGRVTAGTANPNTTFENTIYIQDGTGGIAATGYREHGLPLGSRVRIRGTLTNPDGNPTLEILRLEILAQEAVIEPEEAVCAVSYDQRGAQLLSLEGRVTALTARGDAVSRFTIADVCGDTMDVLVEDSILSGSLGRNVLALTVTQGSRVRAVGLLHLENGTAVLRIRDCDEVTAIPEETAPEAPEESNPDTGDRICLHLFLTLLLPPVIAALKIRRRRM